MSNLDSLLLEEHYFHMYQPLFNLSNWEIYGYESLMRSKLSLNPEDVFALAKKSGGLYELDTQSILKSLITFSEYIESHGKLIFVNVFPSTLSNPLFSYFLDKLLSKITIPCQQIVLEISEGEKIKDMKTFRKIIRNLKSYGFLIAIDDIGKGHSKLHRIIELEPNFVKLDRCFSLDLSISPKKQEIIRIIMDFCKEYTETVLEGIEKPQDLSTAKLLGIPIGQGFLLGEPCLLSKVNKPWKRFTY
jgi:EAL domain-containing protein (putative c-di-GMP-specific phosphodiesterase class I)